MGLYLKKSIWDPVLCAGAAASLVSALCSGFVLTDGLSGSTPCIAGLSFLLMVLFMLFSRNKRSLTAGIILGAVALAAIPLAFRLYGPMNEEENSLTFFLLIQTVTALLVWLLCRTRVGTAVLFCAGSFICAGAAFLEFPLPVWCIFVFLVCCALEFACRVRSVSLKKAEAAGSGTGGYMAQSIVLVLLAAVLALGTFNFVIRPLEPPTRELKLITVLKSMTPLQRLGVSGTRIVFDPELQSQEEPDERQTGNELIQEGEELPDGADSTLEQPQQSLYENITAAVQESFSAVRYESTKLSRLWLFCILLVIPAAYSTRYELRKYRRKKAQSLAAEKKILSYYRYFMKRLNRLGLKRPPNITLSEYAALNAPQLQAFESEKCSFEELTVIYERVLYGHHRVSEEENAKYEAFFDNFYPGLKKTLGSVRYWLCAFRY